MAGRETFGPGMQARERPRLGMEARDKHTQTKDWLSVRALASGVSGLFPELGEKGAGLLDTRTAVLPRAAEGGVGSGRGGHVLSSGLGG